MSLEPLVFLAGFAVGFVTGVTSTIVYANTAYTTPLDDHGTADSPLEPQMWTYATAAGTLYRYNVTTKETHEFWDKVNQWEYSFGNPDAQPITEQHARKQWPEAFK